MRGIEPGDTAFLLVCTALVLMMTPALALFYGGLVRERNVLSVMIQNFVCIGVVGIIWVFGGFSLAFGPSIGGLIGVFRTYLGLHGIGGAAVIVSDASIAPTASAHSAVWMPTSASRTPK